MYIPTYWQAAAFRCGEMVRALADRGLGSGQALCKRSGSSSMNSRSGRSRSNRNSSSSSGGSSRRVKKSRGGDSGAERVSLASGSEKGRLWR